MPNPSDRWKSLAEQLGLVSPDIEPSEEPATSTESAAAAEVPAQNEIRSVGAASSIVEPDVTPPEPVPAKAPQKSRLRDNWGQILGVLGLSSREPEPAEPPAATEQRSTSSLPTQPPPTPTSNKPKRGASGPRRDLPSAFEKPRHEPHTPESRPTETRPTETRASETRPVESRGFEPRAEETRAVESHRKEERFGPRPEPRASEVETAKDSEFDRRQRETFDEFFGEDVGGAGNAGSPPSDDLEAGLRALWDEDPEPFISSARREPDEEFSDTAPTRSGEEFDGPRGGEDQERDPGQRRRRRRRRRGRRGAGESAPASRVQANDRERDSVTEDSRVDDDSMEGDWPAEDALDGADNVGSRPPSRESRHSADRKPRRRRRRRGERAPVTESPEIDRDDQYHDTDDDHGPATAYASGEEDEDPRGRTHSAAHKRITTWEETVGMIVRANLDARSKAPPQPQRPRGRGGYPRR